jgi:hypothetical protein
MALQRTRRPRFRSGRSLCSLGSPLNARPLDGHQRFPLEAHDEACSGDYIGVTKTPHGGSCRGYAGAARNRSARHLVHIAVPTFLGTVPISLAWSEQRWSPPSSMTLPLSSLQIGLR